MKNTSIPVFVAVVLAALLLHGCSNNDELAKAVCTGKQPEMSKADQDKRCRELAEDGNAIAQYRMTYRKSTFEEKFKWLKKAAEQDHAKAQQMLGTYYSLGLGTKLDSNKSITWWAKAAEKGEPTAMYWLARSYRSGVGITKDASKAFYWMKKSAEANNKFAQHSLAFFYINGTGTEKNPGEGFKWLMKSAEQGYSKAQYHVGIAYARGIGVSKNLPESLVWIKKAASNGNKQARKLLESINPSKKVVLKQGVEYRCKQYLMRNYSTPSRYNDTRVPSTAKPYFIKRVGSTLKARVNYHVSGTLLYDGARHLKTITHKGGIEERYQRPGKTNELDIFMKSKGKPILHFNSTVSRYGKLILAAKCYPR